MNKRITIYFLVFFTSVLKGQVGIGTETPNSSSILELNSNNKGMLINKVSLVSSILSTPLSAHIEGMLVYNDNTAGTPPNNVIPGLYYNDGTKWINISNSLTNPKIGDIKNSVSNVDHNGWYLLDGRALSNLPTTARTNATNLGITTNLLDTRDRIIKGIASTETFGSIGGTNNILLSQSNLPSLTISGTTSSNGSHTHTYTNSGNNYWTRYGTSTNLSTLTTLPTTTKTTAETGLHSHTLTIPSKGNNTPISIYPKHITTKQFIYLGK